MLEMNVQRDSTNKRILEGSGWRVVAIWENEIKKFHMRDLKGMLESKGIEMHNEGSTKRVRH